MTVSNPNFVRHNESKFNQPKSASGVKNNNVQPKPSTSGGFNRNEVTCYSCHKRGNYASQYKNQSKPKKLVKRGFGSFLRTKTPVNNKCMTVDNSKPCEFCKNNFNGSNKYNSTGKSPHKLNKNFINSNSNNNSYYNHCNRFLPKNFGRSKILKRRVNNNNGNKFVSNNSNSNGLTTNPVNLKKKLQ